MSAEKPMLMHPRMYAELLRDTHPFLRDVPLDDLGGAIRTMHARLDWREAIRANERARRKSKKAERIRRKGGRA